MRRIFSSAFLVIYIGFLSLTPFVSAQGTPTGDATKTFELIMPATGRANEAFSLTVKALQLDGTVDTTYA
jgi:hypothetical protein